MNCCPINRTGYAHFLMHSTAFPKDQLPRTKIGFYHIALSLGFYTPYIEEHQKWEMVGIPPFLSALSGLRWAFWKDRNLIRGLYHSTTFVAPERWPRAARKAFKLQDPPSPYEVACAITVEPAPNFWNFQRGWDPVTRCAYSALLWWLIGLPEETIITHLGIKGVRGFEELLTRAVRAIMNNRRFSVWACGINLIPLCTNRFMREVADNFVGGKPMPTGRGGQRARHRSARDRLFDHSFVSSQLLLGKRHGTKIRPLYSEGIIWMCAEDKQQWEGRGGVGPERIKSGRTKISEEKAPHPDWLCLSIS